MKLAIGTTLQDRYRIDGVLGKGGMSTVWRAWHLRLNMAVALKAVAAPPAGLSTLAGEAQILAGLVHPNLPRVLDVFVLPADKETEECLCLVMEVVPGDTLERLSHNQVWSEQQVLEWGAVLCEVLAYLHGQNPPVVFRDLKPSNIMRTPEGTLRLIDFGISKQVKAGEATLTSSRGVGSRGYSPIEQYSGGTDPRSDIYSLGATMYALLAGTPPPDAAEIASGDSEMIPLPVLRKDVRPETWALLSWMLESKPGRRPAAIAVVSEKLQVLTGQPVASSSPAQGAWALAPPAVPESVMASRIHASPVPSFERTQMAPAPASPIWDREVKSETPVWATSASRGRPPRLVVLGLGGLIVAAIAWGVLRPRPLNNLFPMIPGSHFTYSCRIVDTIPNRPEDIETGVSEVVVEAAGNGACTLTNTTRIAGHPDRVTSDRYRLEDRTVLWEATKNSAGEQVFSAPRPYLRSAAPLRQPWDVGSFTTHECTAELKARLEDSEPIDVEAGHFAVCALLHVFGPLNGKLESVPLIAGSTTDDEEWYAPGVGMVRQRAVVTYRASRGTVLIHSVNMRLTSWTPGPH